MELLPAIASVAPTSICSTVNWRRLSPLLTRIAVAIAAFWVAGCNNTTFDSDMSQGGRSIPDIEAELTTSRADANAHELPAFTSRCHELASIACTASRACCQGGLGQCETLLVKVCEQAKKLTAAIAAAKRSQLGFSHEWDAICRAKLASASEHCSLDQLSRDYTDCMFAWIDPASIGGACLSPYLPCAGALGICDLAGHTGPTCLPAGHPGDACGDGKPCALSLVCYPGTKVTAKHCGPIGESCSPPQCADPETCDTALYCPVGLKCNPDGKCEPDPGGKVGAACKGKTECQQGLVCTDGVCTSKLCNALQ